MDIESLLEAISEDQPSGPDLRDEAGDLTFETLKELRTEIDPDVDESGEGRQPDWHGIVRLCEEVLRERSKDLEVLAALLEAQVGLEGLPGLEQGLVLLRRSLETFWETLHPGADEEEIALPLRARWLSWIGSPKAFVPIVKKCRIVEAADASPRSWADYERSLMVDDATISPERRQELIDAGCITGEQWQAAVGAAPSELLRELVRAIDSAEQELQAIDALCTERFAAQDEEEEPPSFTHLTDFLSELREYLGGHGGTAAEETPLEETAAGGAASAAGVSGPVSGRQDALRQLREVGDFFRRTEPHSPISYLIARAVKWGSMPLEDLLKDVVRSDDVIQHIWETLGLDGDGGSSEDEEY